MTRTTGGALNDVRVLDLTHALAGSFCSQVLADHGADVIKVEPLEGDFFRHMGPYRSDDRQRAYGGLFQACNRNKRSIAVNLKSPDGVALLKRLAGPADALVENYRAGVLDRIGLGYRTLHALHPRLVYTSVRGFGDKAGGESPYMDWPSFDIVAQAMGGWMGITGADADHPVKVGGGVGDTVPGLFAAFGTMAALWHARASGHGQYVDVAMADSILAMSELVVSQYSYTGATMQPMGNGIPGLAPFGTIAAKDGVIVIAAVHDPQFRELCARIERPDLPADRRFPTKAPPMGNRPALCAGVRGLGRVPFGPIYGAREIFADPHFAARDMLPRVEQPGSAEPVAVPGVPVKLSDTPGAVRRRAPLLGEHTREVLSQELGLSDAALDDLAARDVIGVV